MIGDDLEANPFYDQPLEAGQMDLVADRKEEIERLEKAIKNAAKGFKQNFAVLGDDGSGKTSILNIAEAKAKLVPNILIVRQEITDSTTELTFFKGILGSIVHELEKQVGSLFVSNDAKDIAKRVQGIVKSEEKSAEISVSIGNILSFLGFGGRFSAKESSTRGSFEDVSEIIPSLEEVVREILSKKFKVIVVMIDEAGYANSETTKSLLQRLRLLFQKANFMLTVAGNKLLISDLIKIEPTFRNLIPVNSRIEMRELEETDIQSLINLRINKVRKNPKKFRSEKEQTEYQDPLFLADSVAELQRQTKGNLRLIMIVSSEALELAISEGSDRIKPTHIVSAARSILIKNGKDIFGSLKENERQIIEKLHVTRMESIRGIAEELHITHPFLSRKLSEMKDLGYLEKFEGIRGAIYYRLSRPLEMYLDSLREGSE
ncbi:MAG: AAA family ATPase [Nitrososphaerota archaeon]|nr:AAA family ATPase [Nitrososphaerota archaeon]